jgi:NADH-quinone oxidoreductase subunit J
MLLPATLLFGVLALAAIATAAGLLLSRNTVYAALFLIMNFTTVAVLYLILGAPFIALAQITVYAGAIMVLFLFVIMMLGAERLPGPDPLRFQRPLAIILAVVLLVEGGFVIFTMARAFGLGPLPVATADFASPKAIGLELFNKYLLPFEVTSVLLLVGVIGAVVLTKPEKKRG